MLDQHGNRDFTAVVPGTKLVGDITYLKTGSGWLYLATVIVLATRMVVGWSMSSNMRTQLIIDAMTMARTHGRLATDGAIFHSDYAEESVKPSMGNHPLWFRGLEPIPRLNVFAISVNRAVEACLRQAARWLLR
ncbi:hypothetical protein CQ018_17355 [Arthrobacter sp. MYb227]|nr:hypothetical protein CQ018_17355 [Arthrobacter sp. MYb227]